MSKIIIDTLVQAKGAEVPVVRVGKLSLICSYFVYTHAYYSTITNGILLCR